MYIISSLNRITHYQWIFTLRGVLLGLFLIDAPLAFGSDTELTVHNRSGYSMTFALWKNGKNCTEKSILDANFNLSAPQGNTLTVPADKQIAVGVSIFEMGDKLPVVCDYILSFKLMPSIKYMLEYDVRDRRCFGHLYQSVGGVYQLILPGEGGLVERMSVFGWDKYEPGCEEE